MNKLTIEQAWAKNQAEQIIQEHIHAMMCSTSSYDPKDEDELKDFMLSECAYILSRKLLEGEYTPMEYNAVRNAVTALIYGVFAIQVDDEDSVPESDVIASKGGMTCFSKSTIKRGAYAVC